MSIDARFAAVPLLPEADLADPLDAAPLARALTAGGLSMLELVWRGQPTIDALHALCTGHPQLLAGVGHVSDPAQFAAAVAAGARFISSPGATPGLFAIARLHPEVPFWPGVASLSEAMAAREAGFSRVKLLPARLAGGLPLVEALGRYLPGIQLIPSGDLSELDTARYLAQPNVVAMGADWIARHELLQRRDWAWIEDKAAGAREDYGCTP
ncbi:keto-deoxy-phosphogluconate aldolase [Laribacter hongkongensis]|uniref:bifunctional 4-hydroxy-2-oxoglutarate aldolase/2-dehydro-3-deoxy-phosphogluconate aldolase n=1 Tax=Laribacter hongkongensis TaxID=168471 RepID=UPI00187855B4|nr:keto-deoxy-phosphogluconate aldolase [Laribacter hongkongensis]MCG8995194.1 keto-deoxy-phosphogluconate aldolase [Laribacter hongkongensis]MCG9011473.1 keto-deoxy-phosphogluconate aldolase [Laribacter hongkongensis]MCG9023046.1 keto-deoxy-phosphogluconate aldolase [Laribacter hongkongensis]MCG9048301.1 keto-deoxy-phosphogluconate aldolase [Laribacter hongkongensis]MCG9057905.1 keto-deoxy-phosphogluconate aldolase [Laribacter hongkongensis]